MDESLFQTAGLGDSFYLETGSGERSGSSAENRGCGLEPYSARPHWGKLFRISPQRISEVYEKIADFRELLQTLDPEGKFLNAYLLKLIVSP